MADEPTFTGDKLALWEDLRAFALAVLADLKMRPGEGPFYWIKEGWKGDPEVREIEPRQIRGIFEAWFRALGGWERLEKWRERERDQAVSARLITLAPGARAYCDNCCEDGPTTLQPVELAAGPDAAEVLCATCRTPLLTLRRGPKT